MRSGYDKGEGCWVCGWRMHEGPTAKEGVTPNDGRHCPCCVGNVLIPRVLVKKGSRRLYDCRTLASGSAPPVQGMPTYPPLHVYSSVSTVPSSRTGAEKATGTERGQSALPTTPPGLSRGRGKGKPAKGGWPSAIPLPSGAVIRSEGKSEGALTREGPQHGLGAMSGLSRQLGGDRQGALGQEQASMATNSVEGLPDCARMVTFAEGGMDQALQPVPHQVSAGQILGGEPGGALVPVGGSELAVQFSEWSLSFKRENRAWQQEQERLRAKDKRAGEQRRELDLAEGRRLREEDGKRMGHLEQASEAQKNTMDSNASVLAQMATMQRALARHMGVPMPEGVGESEMDSAGVGAPSMAE